MVVCILPPLVLLAAAGILVTVRLHSKRHLAHRVYFDIPRSLSGLDDGVVGTADHSRVEPLRHGRQRGATTAQVPADTCSHLFVSGSPFALDLRRFDPDALRSPLQEHLDPELLARAAVHALPAL